MLDRKLHLWLVALPALVAWFALGGTPPAHAGGKNQVRGVMIRDDAGTTTVRVQGSSTPTFTVYKLERPTRVVVDVAQATLDRSVRGDEPGATFAVNSWPVSQVAAMAMEDGSTTVRVVVTLARPGRYDVKAEGKDVVIKVIARDAAPVSVTSADLAKANAEAAAARDEVARAKDEVAALKTAAAAARKDADSARAEAKQAQRAAESEQARAKEATAAAARATAAAEAARASAAGASSGERAAADQRVAEAQAAAARAKAAADAAQADARAAQAAATKEVARAKAAADEEIAKARAAASAADERVAAARADVEQAQEAAAAAKADVERERKAATAAKSDVERERKAAAAAKADADRVIAAAKADLARVETQVARAERARDEARAAAAQAETREHNARAAETRAAAERKAAADAMKLAERERAKASGASGEAAKVRAAADEKIKDAEARLARAEQARKDAEQARKAAELAAATARQDASAAQATIAAAATARSQADSATKDALAQRAAAEAQRAAAEQRRADTVAAAERAEQRRAQAEDAAAAAAAHRKLEEKAAAQAAAARKAEEKAAALAAAARQAEEKAAAQASATRKDEEHATALARRNAEQAAAAATAARKAEAQAMAQAAAARTSAEEAAAKASAARRTEEQAAAEAMALRKREAEAAAQAGAIRKTEERATAQAVTARKAEEAAAARARSARQTEEQATRAAANARAGAEARKQAAERAAAAAEDALVSEREAARVARERTRAADDAEAEAKDAARRKASADEIAAARAEAARLAAARTKAERELADRSREVARTRDESDRLSSERGAAAAEVERLKQAAAEARTARAREEARLAEVSAARKSEEQALAKARATTTAAASPATPAPAAVKTPVVAPPARTARIAAVRFTPGDVEHTVVVDLDGKGATAELVRSGSRKAELIVHGATLPTDLARTLDTSRFGGPIRTVSSYTDHRTGDVRVVVELTTDAAPRLDTAGGDLRLNFATAGTTAAAPAKVRSQPGQVVGGFGATSTPVTQTSVAQLGKKKVYRGPTIELDFKDADIHELLRTLADVGRVDIVIPDEIRANVTVRMKRVPWDQALDVILESKGLWYRKTGNLYRIAPRKQLDAEDEAEAARLRALVELEAPKPDVYTLNYTDAASVKPTLEPLLSAKGKIEVDARTNSLIINDLSRNRREIIDLAARLDTQTPQISIEARIVEARSSFERQIGIQWGGRGLAGAAGGSATGLIFPSTIGLTGGAGDPNKSEAGVAAPADFAVNLPAGGTNGAIGLTLGSVGGNVNINLRLSALEEAGTVRIISAPKVTVLNNVEAEMKQGVKIPISIVSAEGTQTQFVNALLSLKVTPYVSQRDCAIVMDIRVTKDEPDFVNVGARGDPTILNKEAKTRMLVADGETSVMGGIYTRNTGLSYSKVPFLGDLPVLGWLFKSRRETDDRAELLIFITPKITNKASLRCTP